MQNSKNYANLDSQEVFKLYDNIYNIDKQTFVNITRTFFFFLCKALIYEQKTYVLPKALGMISLRKRKTQGSGVFDYKLYKETGIKRYIKNNHSEQYAVNFVWDKSVVRLTDRLLNLYFFNPARDFSRELAKYIKENNVINRFYDK